MPSPPDISPLLVWGVLPRLLGVVYFIAFTSLFRDVLMGAGSRGITPVRDVLARIRRDMPGPRRFLHFPSLLWIASSDRALRALPLAGAASALVVVWGGPLAWPALLVCWVVLLSLDVAMDLAYPWESVLFEAGLLALLLPATLPLPSLAALAAPLPVVAWAYRLLLFRVIFGFGKFKFPRGAKFDWSYLRGFLVGQPIPSPVGWLAQKLPLPVLKAAIAFMFVVEVPLPFLIFAGGWARLAAGLGIVMLMVGIQLCGNFGYFNVVIGVLCVGLLDHQASLFDLTAAQVASAPLTHAAVLVVAVGGLLHFPFATWVARGWLMWPTLLVRLPAALRALLALYRFLVPFRVVQAYGVFPPEGPAPGRWIPVIEGTRDGVTWESYVFRSIPSDAFSPPRFVAPHCPRLDHWLVYEGYGTTAAGLFGSFFDLGVPYRFGGAPLDRLLQRLLEGSPQVASHFGRNPFPDPARPPLRVRVRQRLLMPTSLDERSRTGAWWHVHDVGEHAPETGLIEGFWDGVLPEPELFHWDALRWRKRVPAFARLRTDAAARDPHLAVLDGRVSPDEVEAFWRDFVPALQTGALRDWTHLPALWAAIAQRFTRRELSAFELVAARYAHVLATQLEPFFLGDRAPKIALPSWFHVGMLVHATLLEGQGATEALLRAPESASERASELTNEAGLLLWAVFRPGMIRFHARKARVLQVTERFQPEAPIPERIPGFAYLVGWLGEQLVDDDTALLPHWSRRPDLDWQIAKEPPPALPLPTRPGAPDGVSAAAS